MEYKWDNPLLLSPSVHYLATKLGFPTNTFGSQHLHTISINVSQNGVQNGLHIYLHKRLENGMVFIYFNIVAEEKT